MVDNVVTGVQRAIVNSIKRTQRTVDHVQEALASGKDVNSAIDDPQNYFSSKALSNRAADLSRLLDGIAISIRTVEETQHGIDAILKLLNQAEALMDEAHVELFTSSSESGITAEMILEANPAVTYNEDTNSFYQYISSTATAINSRAIANSMTINGVEGHLVNITSQEENDFIQTFTGNSNIWIGGSDAAVEGQWIWEEGVEAGQVFWSGTGATGSAPGGAYENFRASPNEPNGSGDYAQMYNDGTWDDTGAGPLKSFVVEWDGALLGLVEDVEFIERSAQYQAQYLEILKQIDQIAEDTHIRGVHLLKDDDLQTYFNEDRSNFLLIEGIDATALGLGLVDEDFQNESTVTTTAEKIREAKDILRKYSSSVSTDLTVITTRQNFTKVMINNHKAGAQDLVVADQNQKGAEMLALQVREQLQATALSLSSQNSVLALFS